MFFVPYQQNHKPYWNTNFARKVNSEGSVTQQRRRRRWWWQWKWMSLQLKTHLITTASKKVELNCSASCVTLCSFGVQPSSVEWRRLLSQRHQELSTALMLMTTQLRRNCPSVSHRPLLLLIRVDGLLDWQPAVYVRWNTTVLVGCANVCSPAGQIFKVVAGSSFQMTWIT